MPVANVCAGAGADGCIDYLSQAILDAGDEIVCGWPSFPSYVIYARKQGAHAHLVPLRDHRYDLDALAEAITPNTKIVYICHPNNPTGTMNTIDELDAWFERVDERVITVIDQAYFEYIDRDDYPDAIERYFKAGHDVVVLRTFSKIYGLAGQRVGYAVGPERVIAAMTKVRRPFDLTTTAQVAAPPRSTAAPRSSGAARSTPKGSSGSPRSSRSTVSSRCRPSATSSTWTSAATRSSCSSACSTKA